MELTLDNVGILQDSKVSLDGLTVITGKNSSGKTTVGKVVYSLISAGSNPVEAFEESSRSYICNKLGLIVDILGLRRSRLLRQGEAMPAGDQDKLLTVLSSRHYHRFGISELKELLYETRSFIDNLSPESYKLLFLRDKTELNAASYIFLNSISRNFGELRERALYICESAIELINSEDVFYRFQEDRTSAFLNHEFHDQIKPVRASNAVAHIALSDQGKTIVSSNIRSKDQIEFSEDTTFLYPFEKCVFIDNPFVIDRLDDYDNYGVISSSFPEKAHSESLVASKDVASHEDVLIRLLSESEQLNFFSDLEIQKKYGAVFEKINRIVPGEFSMTSDGAFYIEDNAELSVKNLATGSKMFFIIKKLLRNGLLDDTTLLVLDEPESHLHPEWINQFAEILVLLIKDVKLKVLLTTHSPNLMLALNVCARKADILSDSHFYIAECMPDSCYSQIRCIDDSIGEGYSHLSLPLVEMNLQMEELSLGD